MAVNRKYFDQAIGESNGNGGDLQQLGNDLAIVYGQENQVYLALFGGDIEGNTNTIIGSGWWGNTLLYGNDTSKQFNSNTERVLNTTALNSGGLVKIQNAVKSDLAYLKAKIAVTVTIPSVNMVKIEIRVVYPDGSRRLSIITFGKRPSTSGVGDFSIFDFNEDFF